jgi:hypothetical protein
MKKEPKDNIGLGFWARPDVAALGINAAQSLAPSRLNTNALMECLSMGSNSQNRQDVVGWIWLLIIALGIIELHRLIGIRFTTNDDAMGLIWYPSVWESTR